MGAVLWRTPRLVAKSISQAINGEHVIRFTREDVVARLASTQAKLHLEASATFLPSGIESIPRRVTQPAHAAPVDDVRLIPLGHLSARRDTC